MIAASGVRLPFEGGGKCGCMISNDMNSINKYTGLSNIIRNVSIIVFLWLSRDQIYFFMLVVLKFKLAFQCLKAAPFKCCVDIFRGLGNSWI